MDKEGNKTGGRAAGTPNKTTGSLRTWVTEFLNENLDLIKKDFKKLEPKERVFLFEKLLKYSLPQLQATSVKTDLHKLLTDAKDSGVLTDDQLKKLAEMIVEQLKSNIDE